jgi:hypothetical protein
MRQQFDPQSPPLPKDVSQHTAPLWYERAQMQPQYCSDSPVVSQSPAEPRPAALTQPGAELAQSAKPHRLAEQGAFDAILGKRRHVCRDARRRRLVFSVADPCQHDRRHVAGAARRCLRGHLVGHGRCGLTQRCGHHCHQR